jgi:exodeoxyribonuclease-5
MLYTVREIAREGPHAIELEVETDNGKVFTLPALRRRFGHNEIKEFRSKEVALLDYGYCLTVHKAQGSEWDAVTVFEELYSAWDARRWRYTAVTRARERLVYCGELTAR